jgi:3-oxoacyl-[acyl-carrier protein] reductase
LILRDKVSFITGSTRGIGWATAREFARQGATVILNHRGSAALLHERCRELEAEFHGTVVGLAADVTDTPAVKNCYVEIFRRFKKLDILVNNAGILQDALLGMISTENMHAVINTNVVGSLVHLQEASRLIDKARSSTSLLSSGGLATRARRFTLLRRPRSLG